jgi:hypothetical protein
MYRKLLYCLFAAGTLFSCTKDKDPQPVAKVSEINFRFDTHIQSIDVELVIAQKDGQILLDTVLSTHTNHNLSVHSVETTFDVTTLMYNPSNKWYQMNTYRDVNPNNWHLNNAGSPSAPVQHDRGTITYTNLPAYDNTLFFMSRNLGHASMTWSGSTFKVVYDRTIPQDVTYFLLPKYGKYVLAEVTENQTTVSYNQAVSAAKHTFNKPSGITNFNAYLYGYSDDGVYNRRMMLFGIGGPKPTAEYDIMYPVTGFKNFDLDVTYYDAEHYWHTQSLRAVNLPTQIAFTSKSDFTVTKSDYTDFSMTIGQDKPSIYSMEWLHNTEDLKLIWNVYSSPNQTSFKAKTFLENMNFESLDTKHVPALKLARVISEKAVNFDHQAFLDNKANTTASKNNPISASRKIQKSF